jgi:glyoxylase-like metal-dependent hydrolase (beta-lactamase superfamily II)
MPAQAGILLLGAVHSPPRSLPRRGSTRIVTLLPLLQAEIARETGTTRTRPVQNRGGDPMTHGHHLLSRRTLLQGGTALAAAGLAGAPALAKAPMLGTQAPYFYRFKIGSAEATVVSDGVLPLGPPGEAFLGLSKEEIARQLSSNFLPLDNIVLEQNVLIVNTGSHLVLFDTGMGSRKDFGPTTGKLLNSIKQAGIDPKDIDAVVMSHAHIDHLGGNVGDDGKSNFPNAQFYLQQSDFDYWTDDKLASGPLKGFLEQAKKNLLPVRDRIVFIKDGQEFLPGITAIGAPGHTVGHTVFNIASGGKNMVYIGDLTHHPVLLMEKPLTEFAYDTDPKQSAQTRVKLLTRFADEKTPIVAYHFAWPGYGHVAKHGDGFRYYPSPMNMAL